MKYMYMKNIKACLQINCFFFYNWEMFYVSAQVHAKNERKNRKQNQYIQNKKVF